MLARERRLRRNPSIRHTGDGASERPQISHDVAVRAYELYEQRGKEDGPDWEDWLRAEQKVKARTNRHIARPPHHEEPGSGSGSHRPAKHISRCSARTDLRSRGHLLSFN